MCFGNLRHCFLWFLVHLWNLKLQISNCDGLRRRFRHKDFILSSVSTPQELCLTNSLLYVSCFCSPSDFRMKTNCCLFLGRVEWFGGNIRERVAVELELGYAALPAWRRTMESDPPLCTPLDVPGDSGQNIRALHR